MMGEPVEQRRRHLCVAEDAGPLGEGEVCCDDDRGALVKPADQVEEKLTAGLSERQIAQFVEHDKVETGEVIGEPALATGAGLAFEPVDEVDDGAEAAARAAADASAGDGDGKVAFTGAGRDRDIVPDIRGRTRRSTTPFIPASAAESRSCGVIRSGVSPCWWSNSRTGRWCWCRSG